MGLLASFAILLLSAILEAGGDALVRNGLHSKAMAARVGFLALGGVVLFAYGIVVNTPPWDFGKLLGVYVTLFFVVAQTINFWFYGAKPTLPILAGGLLIVAGGLIITFWPADA